MVDPALRRAVEHAAVLCKRAGHRRGELASELARSSGHSRSPEGDIASFLLTYTFPSSGYTPADFLTLYDAAQ
jgi:hypothetical protein